MATVKELEAKIKQLVTKRSGVASHTAPYAAYTADIEKITREITEKNIWKRFRLSLIISLIAIAISILALVRSCET